MTSPVALWQQFFQTDLSWLNEVNTTNLRSLNAVRISVFIAGIFALAFLGTVFVFWRNVWFATAMTESAGASAMLMSGREAAQFARDIFEAFLWFATALGGFAVTGAIGKRLTDSNYQERLHMAKAEVEKAKKAPVIQHITKEQPAVQQNVNVGEPNGEVRAGE